jgi:hypothetical protein
MRDADCQTLEERRRLCLLAFWNVNHEDGNSVQISTKVKNLSAKTTELVDFLALSDKTNKPSV